MNGAIQRRARLYSPRKDRIIASVILCATGPVLLAGCFWLFGVLLPALDPERPGAFTERTRAVADQSVRVGQIHEFWSEQYRTFFWLVALVGAVAAGLLSVWCLYRLFMRLGDHLDALGHWDQMISRRKRRSHLHH
jgi:hypothetical protein